MYKSTSFCGYVERWYCDWFCRLSIICSISSIMMRIYILLSHILSCILLVGFPEDTDSLSDTCWYSQRTRTFSLILPRGIWNSLPSLLIFWPSILCVFVFPADCLFDASWSSWRTPAFSVVLVGLPGGSRFFMDVCWFSPRIPAFSPELGLSVVVILSGNILRWSKLVCWCQRFSGHCHLYLVTLWVCACQWYSNTHCSFDVTRQSIIQLTTNNIIGTSLW